MRGRLAPLVLLLALASVDAIAQTKTEAPPTPSAPAPAATGAGLAADASPPAAPAVQPSSAAPVDAATSRWGAAHLVHASYASSIKPVPLVRLHSWTVHVTDAAGRPVTGAEVTIVGGMPEHTHGFPTVPEVQELGGGDYRVDGLKFHMPGQWVVVLAVRLPDGTHDTVRFEVEVR